MQQEKGKVPISKPIIISTQSSDDVVRSNTEAPHTTTVSSPLTTDSTRLESIVTPDILAS